MFAQKLTSLRKSQKLFPSTESDLAGSLGEEVALEHLSLIQKHLNSRTEILRSVRVPKQRGLGKYEIDLLFVTEKAVLVIEVKHWSGHLSQGKGAWIQERREQKKLLPDPAQSNEEKKEAVRIWLKDRGLDIPEHCIHSLVLLTHPKVTLNTELKRIPQVITLRSLAVTVQVKCGLPKRLLLKRKARPDFDFKKLVRELGELPTWDKLRLHGGRTLVGDMENIVIPGVKATDLQRKKLRIASVSIARRLFPGLLLPIRLQIKSWSGKGKSYSIHPDAKILFRPAGQNKVEEFSLLNVESLRLGWKDDAYYRSGKARELKGGSKSRGA